LSWLTLPHNDMPILLKLATGLRYLRKYGVPPKQNRIMSPDDITQLAERASFVDVESKLIGRETRVICLKGEKLGVGNLLKELLN